MEDDNEKFIGDIRNEETRSQTIVEKDPKTKDFYNSFDPLDVTSLDNKEYKELLDKLDEEEKNLLKLNKNFYEMTFEAIGGLVMPIIIEFTFKDGSKEKQHIPAEIWRFNRKEVTKVFLFDKEVESINLDPNLETADIDRSNNYWPSKKIPSRFFYFKDGLDEERREKSYAEIQQIVPLTFQS